MGEKVYDPLPQSVCGMKFVKLFLDFPEALEAGKQVVAGEVPGPLFGSEMS